MSKRVISALIALPLLIVFTIYGGIIFKLGVSALTLLALYEYVNAYKNTNYKIIVPVFIAIYFLNLIFIFTNQGPEKDLLLIVLAVLISMAIPIFNKEYNVISSALTCIGIVYIIVFFNMLIYVRMGTNGHKFIWLIYIIAWACDTLAYYSGSFLGKHKLCPEVSPKKTVEGSIGGIVGSILGVLIWCWLNNDLKLNLLYMIILGILGGIISQIGDLSASLIKRYVGIKDYGNIMPGHGGILDRFDSILFIAPIVYYYIEKVIF
ncbi:phosphatidate cytidylyltransferase [Caloramator fervidus]|uniref:Phosphatidate cytidylyltransferase n=1 Tax=Caloramator fervidus TaxID=29344 RepID=A0A1H5S6G1_9CLOT|nr:phosphatidate cytidylyltransferase [Caloramator fervidus]SEF45361.1 phosphatidate cytidylyltransferase [Caloramator fervidus]